MEQGIDREVSTLLVNDHKEVELTLKIPLPPDELFHIAGIPHASKIIEIEEVDEVFSFQLPQKVEPKPKVIYYPNENAPVWVIFVYKFAQEIIEVPVEANRVNLFDKLLQSK